MPCHSQWSIGHRPLVSILLYLVLGRGSSIFLRCSLLFIFITGILMIHFLCGFTVTSVTKEVPCITYSMPLPPVGLCVGSVVVGIRIGLLHFLIRFCKTWLNQFCGPRGNYCSPVLTSPDRPLRAKPLQNAPIFLRVHSIADQRSNSFMVSRV